VGAHGRWRQNTRFSSNLVGVSTHRRRELRHINYWRVDRDRGGETVDGSGGPDVSEAGGALEGLTQGADATEAQERDEPAEYFPGCQRVPQG
jgi:hypothetical protein